MVYFKKIKEIITEYEAETGNHISLHDLFVNFLNYTEEDYEMFLNSKGTKIPKKPSGESKRTNKIPIIPNNVGDKENPEYEKYYNMVLEFRKYMCNKDIRPEGDEKKTMRTFMKYAFNLEGDDATKEMRKIEYIVYKGKVSKSNKRNRRREKREAEFREKFNLTY